MDTVRVCGQRDIRAIIDNKPAPVVSRELASFFGKRKEISWNHFFGPQLQQGHAAPQQLAQDSLRFAIVGLPRVENGIKRRKLEPLRRELRLPATHLLF
jgi:hypothetical protein